MSLEWGKVNFRQEIEDILRPKLPPNLNQAPFSFEHIKSGFTDNVFLLSVGDANRQHHSYIIKEYLEEWHLKEKRFYETVLQNHPELGAPQVITSGERFLILEYLDEEVYRPFTAQDIDFLHEWISHKYSFFRNHQELTEDFAEKREVQIHYLVKKPLKMFARLETAGVPIPNNIQTEESHFINIIDMNNLLPQSLEHGDLESQNLLVGNTNNLRVLDWVNARRGSGLFDINQFFETAESLRANIDTEKVIQDFAKETGLSNLAYLLTQVRILMLLNKINFYGEKHLSGEKYSHSQSKPVLDLLISYINELKKLLYS